MEKRTLGKTGIELSEVSLGTWGLASKAYGPSDDRRFERVVERALERGLSTFDMAPLWGDGQSEAIVAKVVGAKRDQAVYVTRAGMRWDDRALATDFDAESLVEDCEDSLRRLDTDHIDLWLLHNPPETAWPPKKRRRKSDEPDDADPERNERLEEWKAASVDKLLKDGKIKAWGVSVSTPEQARLAIAAGAQAVCIAYNILLGDDLHDLSGDLSVAECGVLARSPLFYGLLSGRWSENRNFPEYDHRRDRWHPQSLKTRVRQVNKLRFLIHDEVHSMVAASMRYVLANKLVTTAIAGCRTIGQVEEMARSVKGAPYLPEDDLLKLPQVLAAAGV